MFDCWVWVSVASPELWARFMSELVDPVQRHSGWPWIRDLVFNRAQDTTTSTLDVTRELKRMMEGETIYLRGTHHQFAMAAFTDSDAVVFGLTLNLPEADYDPAEYRLAERASRGALDLLFDFTGAIEGMFSQEFAPPANRLEWESAENVERRTAPSAP